ALTVTNYCLAQGSVYNKEKLATVLSQLVDKDPIPVLFMRTLLQALHLYKDLVGFAMNVLSRLISKRVWENKSLWEGFIRCAHLTQPHSCHVLLKLGKPQLQDVLVKKADLREPLLAYANTNKDSVRPYVFELLATPQTQTQTQTQHASTSTSTSASQTSTQTQTQTQSQPSTQTQIQLEPVIGKKRSLDQVQTDDNLERPSKKQKVDDSPTE
ncbi:hypothetical protein RFI_29210, partial [Reticulomyxa filosa]